MQRSSRSRVWILDDRLAIGHRGVATVDSSPGSYRPALRPAPIVGRASGTPSNLPSNALEGCGSPNLSAAGRLGSRLEVPTMTPPQCLAHLVLNTLPGGLASPDLPGLAHLSRQLASLFSMRPVSRVIASHPTCSSSLAVRLSFLLAANIRNAPSGRDAMALLCPPDRRDPRGSFLPSWRL